MPFTVVGFLREHKVLPEAHLYGAAIIIGNTQERRAFLNGMHSIVGWPSFFPYAFLVKTPLALLAFIAIAALLARPSWRDLLP